MPYIGNTPALDYISYAVQNFTVTAGTTSYALDYSVANENDIRLVINNVIQRPGASFAYSATGTTLTLTSATLATDTMYAVFIGRAVQTVTPPANSITNTMLNSSAITGQTAETSVAGGDLVLIYDDSATALRKMTRTNFVSGLGAAAGQVIQVVQATDSTSRTTTSNTFVTASSTLTVNITPSSASNKILVVLLLCGFGADTQNTNARATVFRDATNISPANGFADNNVVSGGAYYVGAGNSVLDSPNTTSQITYQFYMQNSGGANTARVNNGGFSSLTCLEIKG